MGLGDAALSSLPLAIYVLGSYNAHFSFPTAIIFFLKKACIAKDFWYCAGIWRAWGGVPGPAEDKKLVC